MLIRKVSLTLAGPLILGTMLLLFFLQEEHAEALTSPPKTVWSNEACLRCHNDPVTLRKMQDKRDDETFCQAAYDHMNQTSPKHSNVK